MKLLSLCLLLSAPLLSCASYNVPLKKFDAGSGYRYLTIPRQENNSESLFVILAFSGGGTRAAALSYGALEEIRKTKIEWEGRKGSLLDEVDVISSVSGGSFTAAYYAVFGNRIFSDFDRAVLKRNITANLLLRLLNPVSAVKLVSPHFDRIDLAARYYDKSIFKGKTFGDLHSVQRPFTIINATDVSMGARFEFTQDQFDPICSDVDQVAIGTAVAASSAFPGLLTPLTIENFGGKAPCGYQAPLWLSVAFRDREKNRRRYEASRRLQLYKDGIRRPYIHLADGGISDNIGVRPAIEALLLDSSAWSISRGRAPSQPDRLGTKIKKIVVIVVNAKTSGSLSADKRRNAPKALGVITGAAFSSMGNYSFDSIRLLENVLSARSRKSLSPRDVYAIEVGFEALYGTDAYESFARLPTTLHLPSATVDKLKAVGARLLRDSEDFKRLCTAIGIQDDKSSSCLDQAD